MKISRGDRFTNHLGKICTVKSVYKGIIKLQVIDTPSYVEVWNFEDFAKANFIKIPMPKISRLNIGKHLLEYQLNMLGKTVHEAKKTDRWYFKWTLTEEQYDYFKSYAIPLLKKTFKCNRKKARETFGWFNLQFGLKVLKTEKNEKK